MLNTCRADLYRLFRGKALYISFILFISAIVYPLLTGEITGMFSFGVTTPDTTIQTSPLTVLMPTELTALTAPFQVMSLLQPLVLIALPLIYVISATDFNSGAIQNAIASGLSRPQIYFAKLFLSFGLVELFYIIALLAGVVIGVLVGGVGEVSEELVASFLRAFGTQSLMLLTATSVGTAIIFITRKGAALNAIYLLFFLGGTILLATLSVTGTNYLAYDFLSNMTLAATFDSLSPEQVTKMFSTITVYLALSMVLGLASFRRVAIK